MKHFMPLKEKKIIRLQPEDTLTKNVLLTHTQVNKTCILKQEILYF